MAPSGPETHQDRFDVASSLVKSGAEIQEQIRTLGFQKDALVGNGFDANNASFKAKEAQIKALQTNFDALAARWAAQTGKPVDKYQSKVRNFRWDNEGTPFMTTEDETSSSDTAPEKIKKGKEAVLTGSQMKLSEFKQELTDMMGDKAKLNHAAALLADAIPPLLPLDLKQGDRRHQAVDVLFGYNPYLASYIHQNISDEDAPDHAIVGQYLTKMSDSIAKYYDTIRDATVSRQQFERATLEGGAAYGLKKFGREMFSTTEGLASFTLISIAVISYLTAEKGSNWSKFGIASGIAGLLVAGDVGLKSQDKLGVLERAGLDPFSKVPPEVIQRVMENLPGFPREEKDVILDFVGVMNLPMTVLDGAMEDAVRSGGHSVDISKLYGLPTNIANNPHMKGPLLYKALEFFYGTTLYNKGLVAGEVIPSSKMDERLLGGIAYSKKHHSGDILKSAVYTNTEVHAANVVADRISGAARAGSIGSAGMEVGTDKIENSVVAEFIAKYPRLKEALRFDRDNIYLVKGFPYRVDISRNGLFTFTPALSTVPDGIVLPGAHAIREGEETLVSIDGLVDEAAQWAEKVIDAQYAGDPIYKQWKLDFPQAKVMYRNDGNWEFVPALGLSSPNVIAHVGFPHFEEGKVLPIVFNFGGGQGRMKMRLETEASKEYFHMEEARKDQECMQEDLFVKEVKDKIGHALCGVDFVITNITDDLALKQTTLEITYKGDHHTGKLVYENDALKSFDLATNKGPDLEKAWTDAAAADAKGFLDSKTVQDALSKVSSQLDTSDGSIWSRFSMVLKGFKDDFESMFQSSIDNRYDEEFVKQIRGLQRDMRDLLKTNLYLTNPKKDEYDQQKEKYEVLFANRITGMVKEKSGLALNADETAAKARFNTLGVTHAEEVDVSYKESERAKVIEDKFAEVSKALSLSSSLTWFTDSNYRAFREELLGRYKREFAADINTLTAPFSRKDVQAKTDTWYKKACKESAGYLGKTGDQSIEKMVLERLDASNGANWKEATLAVKDYLTKNIDWDSYGIVPNAETMMQVLDLWFKKIDSGKAAVTKADANAFADFFKWEFAVRMGGDRRYTLNSPLSTRDLLEPGLQTVSDTRFREGYSALSASPDYSTWFGSGAQAAPLAPELQTDLEASREFLKKDFDSWYVSTADCGALFKLDSYYPQIQKQATYDRLAPILTDADPNLTPLQLRDNIDAYKRFVLKERYMIFEGMIVNRVDIEHNGREIREQILNKLMTAPLSGYGFYAHRDYTGYEALIRSEMAQIFKNFHSFPPSVGIPVA